MSQSAPQVYDHYGEAKAIAALLQQEGSADQGQRVLEAMSHFSGTEIFMHLRYTLAPLLSSKVLSETTKKRIQTLHGKLDEALKK